jgi:CheY-like chemotaxis protein
MGERADDRAHDHTQDGHGRLVSRLLGMGIALELLPGGRAARGTLTLTGGNLAATAGARSAREVRFATVGERHIKCLEPDWLFPLPLVAILGCADPGAIEGAIRAAWDRRRQALERAAAELAQSGFAPSVEAGGSVLAFPLPLEDGEAWLRVIRPGEVILPARGPLTGLPLSGCGERLLEIDRSGVSALDLELELTAHLERLAARHRARSEVDRARGTEPIPARGEERARPRLLRVGPLLQADRRLLEGLRVRRIDVLTAVGLGDALDHLERRSCELVLIDARIGRDEGVDLIPALARMPGIEHVPVVVVDDRRREGRREAARRAGAAGYLTHPISLPRVGARLERLLAARSERRFSRYPRHLAVRCPTSGTAAHTSALGRLGMFLCREWDAAIGSVEPYQISLPELGRTVEVEAETLYHRPPTAQGAGGQGLRFRGFQGDDEAVLIRYLGLLEAQACGPPAIHQPSERNLRGRMTGPGRPGALPR